MKLYRCKHCGQIISVVKETGVNVFCCGEAMEEIIPGVVDASKEKHIPVVSVEDEKVIVNVGSISHPMEEKHYIEWICIETKKGCQKKILHPGDEPKACFRICKCDELVAVYAYCNLHGLWKA